MPKTTLIPEQVRSGDFGLPPAGDWAVDTERSSVSFSGRASRIAPTVRGSVDEVRGGLHLAVDPNDSRVGVCLDLRTVTTGNAVWDEMLRAADPFQAGKHPLAHYVSHEVRWTGSGFEVAGVLAIAGNETPLTLKARVQGNADGSVTLSAEGTIDPRSAGISLNVPGARMLMPRAMQLSILVVALRTETAAGDPKPSRRFALAS